MRRRAIVISTVAVLTSLLVIPAAAEDAKPPDCPLPGGNRARVEALFKDLGNFIVVYVKGGDQPLGGGGPEVSQAEAEACVSALLATPSGAKAYLGGLAGGVWGFGVDVIRITEQLMAAKPGTSFVGALYQACLPVSDVGRDSVSIPGRYLGILYRDFADRTFSAEKDPDWPARPRSPRLWPAAALRDHLVPVFYAKPIVDGLGGVPVPPKNLLLPPYNQLAAPDMSTPAYRDYLAWLEPSAWPGDGNGTPNPLLGAVLGCMGDSGILSELNKADF